MKIHRLISILLFLESNGTMKAKEIAEKLEVSIRTVYRDIDTLSESGIPLTATTGPNGGVMLMEGYSVAISDMHDDDLFNLYLSGIGIHPDKKSEMALKINNALLKLQKNMSAKKELQAMRNRIYMDDQPWWGEAPRLLYIDQMMRAVFESKILEIDYQKVDGTVSTRYIHAYGVIVKRLNWYIVAYCERSKAVRTFKCERVVGATLKTEGFIFPNEFSLEEYWKKSKQVFLNTCAKEEYFPVVLQLNKRDMGLLDEQEVLHLTGKDETITATINLYGYEQAANAVMKLIAHVEVLEPAELRGFVKRELAGLLDRYKGSVKR
ncbi:WYL domain-containing protein [Bacillus sp. JCM 19041]|uniref:helix-turn-helix transcriptional regulator n=1 Tax=Bacillus sp. JCM 19041 TaxID=1460637 RepID=UPI0006D13C3C